MVAKSKCEYLGFRGNLEFGDWVVKQVAGVGAVCFKFTCVIHRGRKRRSKNHSAWDIIREGNCLILRCGAKQQDAAA